MAVFLQKMGLDSGIGGPLSHLPGGEIDIEAIRAGMAQNAEERKARQQKQRSVKADNTPHTAPEEWERKYQELVAQGGDDIVIGYIRLSDLGQGERNGFDAQVQDITAWAYTLKKQETRYLSERGVDIWVTDLDYSGKMVDRPGIDWIRAKIAQGKVRCVVSNKFDRQARNPAFDAQLGDEAKKKKCYLKSVHESIPEGEVGVLLKGILACFAAYELHVMSTRLMGGKRALVRTTGVSISGMAPYGYRLRGNRYETGHGKMTVCPLERPVVVLVYKLRVKGYAPPTIAAWLIRQGILTRHGGAWSPSTIRHILSHEAAYRGEGLFSEKYGEADVAPAHEAILPTRPVEARAARVTHLPTLRLAAIPDNPDDDPIIIPDITSAVRAAHQGLARSCRQMIAWQERGYTGPEIAQKLNAKGYRTPAGLLWNYSTVYTYLRRSRRDEIAGLIARAEIDSEPLDLGDGASQSNHGQSPELAAIARIRGLLSQSPPPTLRSVVVTLAQEGHLTAQGSPWHLSAVQRVAVGGVRHTERRANIEAAKDTYNWRPTESEREAQRVAREMRQTTGASYARIGGVLATTHTRADGGDYTSAYVRGMVVGQGRWADAPPGETTPGIRLPT